MPHNVYGNIYGVLFKKYTDMFKTCSKYQNKVKIKHVYLN